MVVEWLRVEWLSFGALGIYAFLTYLIARDIYNPLVSFALQQRELTHLDFNMVNKSKVEVEVFGKLWSNAEGELFEFRDNGFYNDGKHWILQPFTSGHGHFDLKGLENEDGLKIEDFVKNKKIPSIEFNLQIKYRRVAKNWLFKKIIKSKWKITSPQNFIYDFNENLFWLNV